VRTTGHITTGLSALAAIALALLVWATLAGAASAAPRIDPSGARGSSGSTSLNWSGYSIAGGTYTSVTATWTQPAVVPRSSDSYAAFWVGLDGDGSDTVEQIGTMGYTDGGASYYVAWYEMYPDAMQLLPSVPIRPGDVVTATVQWAGSTSFRLTLLNQTTGRSFTIKETSSTAQRASAEVIAEAPADGAGVLPLARFGLAGFSGCAVDGGSMAAAGAAAIDMVDSGGSVIAATSALSADGTAFTVTDDFTPPVVAATNLQRTATRGWKDTPVRVRLRGSDGEGGSGVAAVYYTVDNGETHTYAHAFRVSDPGSHVVQYWAVDKAGNTGKTRAGYVNLDFAAPSSAPSAVSVRRRAAQRGSSITVPVTLGDPLPSCGIVKLEIRVVDGSGRTVTTVTRRHVAANGTMDVRVRLRSTLAKGFYMLCTTATDAAGNAQVRAGKARLTVR
jgi:hypothetical protein